MFYTGCFLLLFIIPNSLQYDCCKHFYCFQAKTIPLPTTKHATPAELLPGSPASTMGCDCKMYPEKYVQCGGNACNKTPHNITMSVLDFRIVTSEITSIQRQDFAAYQMLEILKIEHNDNLETIEEYSFENLKNLHNLSISHNMNLKYLKPRTFAGLVKLKHLFLMQNGFRDIVSFSGALGPEHLPIIYNLVLRDNYFRFVNSTDFMPMKNSPLGRLDMAQCKIEKIVPDSFTHFKKLDELHIDVNQIHADDITNIVIAMMKANIPLKFLGLAIIGLRKSPPKQMLEAIGNSTVECLDLAGNQFEILEEDAFPPMENLKLIDFRYVFAADIHKNAFRNVKKLETLLLGNNQFTTVPLGARVESLTGLCVKLNSLYSSSYFLEDYTFAKMNKLEILDLTSNSIKKVFNTTFAGLTKLETLWLTKCSIDDVEPGAFTPLKRLTFLDFQENALTRLVTNTFQGLDNLSVLLLGNNKIMYVDDDAFSSLKSLLHLGLDDNNILHLNPQYMKPMPKLNILNLMRNSVSSWTSRLFPDNQNLTSLYLGNNRVTRLSWAMLDDFQNLTELLLSKNNLICDCAMYDTYTMWVTENGNDKIIEILQNSNAKCAESVEPVTKYLLDKRNDDLCGVNYTPIIASSIVVLVVLVTVSYLIYYYRWHWRYYFFLTRLHLVRKGKKKAKREKTGHSNYEYDAFVSYSNEDSSFVIRLVSMLENSEPFLKLCVYERDFRVGSIISESILENVTKSRKVLIIISESYVKSHWCQWETHIAQHCNLFFKDENGDFADDSLILIKFGNVNEKNLTPTLKYLLKTRIYLQWDKDENKQTFFWNKLRENVALGRDDLPTLTRL